MPISLEYLGPAQAPASVGDFYFLRHGKTDLNEKEVFVQGEKHWGVQGAGTNIGLNETGKRQAVLAGNVLRKLPISSVVCSPLLRAIQTAVIANIGCLCFEIDDDLKERDFGKHEGGYGPLKMFEENYPDTENTELFSMRVAKALAHAETENTLFVSHGGVLRVVAALLGVELTKEHTDNGRVLHFRRGCPQWTVEIHQSPVILISGPSRGIGKAIAENLIAHGYRMSLGARRVKDLESAFGPQSEWLHYARFDAEDNDTMAAWVTAAVEKFGRIDGLINNAGCGEPVNLEKDIDYKQFHRQWHINCVAPLRMTELCLPYLCETGSGRVVNINSMSGQRVLNPFVGYNMTKHALGGLTKTTQHVGWDRGVRAIDICPGFVATEMSAWTDLISSNDMIQPNDIANLVREAIERPNRAYVPRSEVMCMKESIH
ncbi:SDR family NAD(P)-dependent oxidoreductase [Rhizobium rhizogenes]|uniref:Agropine synthesis reductase n=2 Tax=Rhizobium rhizogenes TaxID=359 RepID=MAS12_RHIRH|nr:SDR family NAD(P)-dependent oxidoreductase [Rhizobium rhizogenes]P50201.1 RecName: Full=Agropine synthesis reductase [Rhizobium rhizogenes]AAA22101.1 mas1` [Rhizobium rhizogenes]NTG71388.1 SDR family NAD(P)-dependent oxidoreductase [Rhizobium rhizogenes]TRB05093.1 SDR family NAD(P)-dependent oxidoreductase [Rhizobium rhizogenes]TRB39351.1 SDR family NAD(P)-dependent oxidoreductase [Rhizobium rhizogenes]TRB54628.1 SDR family NAD(P)-dependent oxidoreductase [Rhizobium rhizogenes]